MFCHLPFCRTKAAEIARTEEIEISTVLTAAQRAALEVVSSNAASRAREAAGTIQEVLQMSNLSFETYNEAVAAIQNHGRIALHFHPDRPDFELRTVAQALLEQGLYKSQFETGLSSGSLSAYPGGERDLWERRLFGEAYHKGGCTDRERPKYGALDLLRYPDGPSPRFGSCYFLLSPSVTRRSTFTYLDSHRAPGQIGTLDSFDLIMAAFLEEVFVRDSALGARELTPRLAIERLLRLGQPAGDRFAQPHSRNLNLYIEAQVHGDVSLRTDVDSLVADPSFQGTAVGNTLEQLCRTYGILLSWHAGFVLDASQVPDDFRGPSMPSLARRIARNDRIDAYTIGLAAMELKSNPEAWHDRGPYPEVLQQLKLLWHVLVKYGRPGAE